MFQYPFSNTLESLINPINNEIKDQNCDFVDIHYNKDKHKMFRDKNNVSPFKKNCFYKKLKLI